MRVVPSLLWAIEGHPAEPLDPRLLPLLQAIVSTRSLAGAVEECGISYRAGWGLLRDYHAKLGVALVTLQRGRGASLTAAGEKLLAASKLASQRFARVLATLAVEVGGRAPPRPAAPKTVLRIAASHDLALAALAQALPGTSDLTLELSFMGSLHAIEEFADGRADMAGFHLPVGDRSAVKPFLKRLRPQRDRLIRFADREQGLIVPRGNPGHLRTFRDIAMKGVRFLNRQRGSGTRLIIDRMLEDAGLAPDDINGYPTEEFTHAAVAATVASGGADVGFGLRAAAAEYQLGFVPLVRERYFLAARAKELESAGVSRFITALQSAAGVRAIRAFPGYEVAGAGRVCSVESFERTGGGAAKKLT